jgi:hypothetical protein
MVKNEKEMAKNLKIRIESIFQHKPGIPKIR